MTPKRFITKPSWLLTSALICAVTPAMANINQASSHQNLHYVLKQSPNTVVPSSIMFNSYQHSKYSKPAKQTNSSLFDLSYYVPNFTKKYPSVNHQFMHTVSARSMPSNAVDTALTSNNDSMSELNINYLDVSQHQVATLHAVAELCHQILPRKQHQLLDIGLQKRFDNLLPNIGNYQIAFRQFYKQKNYKALVKSFRRSGEQTYTKEQNLAVCNELVHLSK